MKMSDILKNLFILCCCISFCCATTWMTPVERNVTHNVFTCWSNSSTSNASYTIWYNGNLLFDGPFMSKNFDMEKFKVDIGDKSTNLMVKLDEQDCGVNVSCQYETEIAIKEEKIICKKPLGDRCTDSNQCADRNSKCKEAVGNQTCQCISTHYNDSGICQIRSDSGHKTGLTVGIVSGSFAIVVLCIVGYYCWKRYNRRRSARQNANCHTNRADNETGEELDELKKHDVSQFEDPFSKTCKRCEVEPFLTC